MSNSSSIPSESHVYTKVDDILALTHSTSPVVKLCCHKNDQDRVRCWLNHLISRLAFLSREYGLRHQAPPRASQCKNWVHRQKHKSEGGNGLCLVSTCTKPCLIRLHSAKLNCARGCRGIERESAQNRVSFRNQDPESSGVNVSSYGCGCVR